MRYNSQRVNRAQSSRSVQAFTLMEMILVLAIIGILVSLGIFSMKGVIDGAERAKASADASTIQTNLVRYRTTAGMFPSQAQGLDALAKKPSGAPVPKSWYKLTEASTLIDPWGHPYQYRNPGKKNTEGFDVFSLGKDGIEGTEDDVWPQ